MEFRLLGAVEAFHDGRRIGLGPRKQRLTLAVLALEANRPVPVARLVALNWPESPPRTAEHAIRVAVSRLRSAFGGVPEVELLSQGPAYVLRTDPLHIDVHRFRDLLRRARAASDDRAGLGLLEAALSLWRGPVLAGAAPPEVQERLGEGLEEARLSAVEDRVDTELRLGRHRALLEELTALTRTHPFRERLTCQLMTALYRGGQTHAALEVARRARRRLADELGIDPCPEFRDLEMLILRNEPAPPDRPPDRPAPAQLPPAVLPFTGRSAELRLLDELAEELPPPGAVAIVGPPGIGKTALAVHWAHRVRDRFPDGQLYIDLHAYGSRGALPRLLRSLGADDTSMTTDEAAALYRTLLADRRMLVVLDNAVTSEQVRPLLPGAGGSLTLATSRRRLSGLIALDGARPLRLRPLDPGEAHDLLARLLGQERMRAEAAVAARLAELCDHLPAALRLAAADLAAGRAIADVVAGLEGRDDLVPHAAPPVRPPERRKLGLAGVHCNRTMRRL
ncbi:BTAD domain-containing putative transcriptional regulator [Nonomuraea sp. NPDC048826]|uniref:AfsR/SARP family transcriptional regulator n=1 Tax=Nonomuraea sp. NPDC048826 TaxID=3364347 RepID=UPI003710AAB8